MQESGQSVEFLDLPRELLGLIVNGRSAQSERMLDPRWRCMVRMTCRLLRDLAESPAATDVAQMDDPALVCSLWYAHPDDAEAFSHQCRSDPTLPLGVCAKWRQGRVVCASAIALLIAQHLLDADAADDTDMDRRTSAVEVHGTDDEEMGSVPLLRGSEFVPFWPRTTLDVACRRWVERMENEWGAARLDALLTLVSSDDPRAVRYALDARVLAPLGPDGGMFAPPGRPYWQWASPVRLRRWGPRSAVLCLAACRAIRHCHPTTARYILLRLEGHDRHHVGDGPIVNDVPTSLQTPSQRPLPLWFRLDHMFYYEAMRADRPDMMHAMTRLGLPCVYASCVTLYDAHRCAEWLLSDEARCVPLDTGRSSRYASARPMHDPAVDTHASSVWNDLTALARRLMGGEPAETVTTPVPGKDDAIWWPQWGSDALDSTYDRTRLITTGQRVGDTGSEYHRTLQVLFRHGIVPSGARWEAALCRALSADAVETARWLLRQMPNATGLALVDGVHEGADTLRCDDRSVLASLLASSMSNAQACMEKRVYAVQTTHALVWLMQATRNHPIYDDPAPLVSSMSCAARSDSAIVHICSVVHECHLLLHYARPLWESGLGIKIMRGAFAQCLVTDPWHPRTVMLLDAVERWRRAVDVDLATMAAKLGLREMALQILPHVDMARNARYSCGDPPNVACARFCFGTCIDAQRPVFEPVRPGGVLVDRVPQQAVVHPLAPLSSPAEGHPIERIYCNGRIQSDLDIFVCWSAPRSLWGCL